MNDEVVRRLETAKKKAVRDRNYRRARDRALVRLAQLYPDTYKQLLEIEKAFDEQEGKKWREAIPCGLDFRWLGRHKADGLRMI